MSMRAMFVGNAPPATLGQKPADQPLRPLPPGRTDPDPATLPTGEAMAPALHLVPPPPERAQQSTPNT